MNQDRLAVVLRKLFPSHKIYTNVRKEGDVPSPFSGIFLELDYWIPALRVAFEYQDPHHYESTLYSYADPIKYTEGDIFKKETLSQRGDTLISVPYWWDGKEESLMATLQLVRKDILPSYSFALPPSPIPSFPPFAQEKASKIPGVGELMLASFASSSMLSLDSWWMMEKYDGTRVCWNPDTKKLYTRSGQEAPLPPILFISLPPRFIDGEIWLGRNSVKNGESSTPKEKYQFLRLIGLDCPILQTHEFEERYKIMLENFPVDHSLLILVACAKCQNKSHLRAFTKEIIRASGEGCVVRKPKSLYARGRSESLLKLKAYRDWEGLVVNTDQTGYHILTPEGSIVSAPRKDPKSSDLQPHESPEIGNVVTFVSVSGTHESPFDPRFTRIVAVRHDISWRDVVENAEKAERDHTGSLSWVSEKAISDQPMKQPQGHWTVNESQNSRKYFDEFATSRNFDPLVAENWYHFQGSDFKNASSIMSHYNSSLYKALSSVYPNIGLEMSRFATVPHNYWTELENRKRFFDVFARNHMPPFDPLIPENWYPFTGFSFHDIKGGHSVMSYYNGSLTRALTELYPEVIFDEYSFKFKPREYWSNKENRRIFFTRYAQKNGFNPLHPANWYSWRLNKLDSEHNAQIISSMYSGSYARALMDLFPEVKFDASRFGEKRVQK